MKKSILFAAFVAFVALVLSSCGKEPEKPKAIFEYSIDELTVTFTNLSRDADSYAWDFGDGETSTEKDPVHTYTAADTYQVTLTAMNEGGEAIFTESVKLTASFIKIDGQFDDWDRLDAANEATLVKVNLPEEAMDAGRTSFKQAWCATDEDFIYYMFEFNANTGDVVENMSFSFYIDADNDGSTGKDRDSYWAGSGAEYQLEYGDGAGADAHQDQAAKYWQDWSVYNIYCFGDGAPADAIEVKDASAMSDVIAMNDGLARIEFRIPRANFTYVPLTNQSAWGCRFCDETWDCSGQLPAHVMDAEGAESGLPMVNFKFNN